MPVDASCCSLTRLPLISAEDVGTCGKCWWPVMAVGGKAMGKRSVVARAGGQIRGTEEGRRRVGRREGKRKSKGDGPEGDGRK